MSPLVNPKLEADGTDWVYVAETPDDAPEKRPGAMISIGSIVVCVTRGWQLFSKAVFHKAVGMTTRFRLGPSLGNVKDLG